MIWKWFKSAGSRQTVLICVLSIYMQREKSCKVFVFGESKNGNVNEKEWIRCERKDFLIYLALIKFKKCFENDFFFVGPRFVHKTKFSEVVPFTTRIHANSDQRWGSRWLHARRNFLRHFEKHWVCHAYVGLMVMIMVVADSLCISKCEFDRVNILCVAFGKW